MNPHFALHYQRALLLERSGRYREAADAFGEAAKINPLNIDAQIHLGLVLREIGRDEEANHAFLQALDLRRRDVFTPYPGH